MEPRKSLARTAKEGKREGGEEGILDLGFFRRRCHRRDAETQRVVHHLPMLGASSPAHQCARLLVIQLAIQEGPLLWMA
jgi:hypothetical protein